MGVDGRLPFTELFEVAQRELVREASLNQEDKYKGHVNRLYLNELPSILPERFIKKEAFITTVSEYTTGTVTVGSATAGVEGAGVTWSSADTDKYIKINGRDRLYRVSFSNSTLLTFQDSLPWVESSGTGLSYSIFQDRYQLASDFAFMWEDDDEDPNAVSRYVSNAKLFMDPLTNADFERRFSGVIGDVWSYTVKWTKETPYLVLLSAPSVADIMGYEYVPQLTTLIEYTVGTVTLTATTAVIGAGMNWSGSIDTSANTYYLRNDADGVGSASQWAKIVSVENGTALTLTSAFGFTSGTGITYTISEISKWPARFDSSLLYKTALIVDPDNIQSQKWTALYQESMSIDLTNEAKRTGVSPLKQFYGMRNNRR